MGDSTQEPRAADGALKLVAKRAARKIGIGAAGGLVIIAGVVMLVTPGPGIVTILLGLSILGREFSPARSLLGRLRAWAHRRGFGRRTP